MDRGKGGILASLPPAADDARIPSVALARLDQTLAQVVEMLLGLCHLRFKRFAIRERIEFEVAESLQSVTFERCPARDEASVERFGLLAASIEFQLGIINLFLQAFKLLL